MSAVLVAIGGAVVAADEGMLRFDQLPTDAVKSQYGVTPSPSRAAATTARGTGV